MVRKGSRVQFSSTALRILCWNNKQDNLYIAYMSTKKITIIFLTSLVIVGGGVFFSALNSDNVSQVVVTVPNRTKTEIIQLNDGDDFFMQIAPVVTELEGNRVQMLAYNGSIPGPILKVKQGSTVNLTVKNTSGINQMLHSHGLRLENKYDGTHLVQEPIKNGDSFVYRLTFPDAGVYWYHPHLREDYAQELGLYGNFWVVPDEPNYWTSVDKEELLVLDDILLTKNGIAPFLKNQANHTLMGRFGNTYLINGETDYRLDVNKGETVRFFLTNVANTRTFRFKIKEVQLKLVGADNSKYEKESFVDFIDIAPSERVVIEAKFDQVGEFALLNDNPVSSNYLGAILVNPSTLDDGLDFAVLRNNQEVTEDVKQSLSHWADAEQKSIRLSVAMDHGMMMDHGAMMMGVPNTSPIEWEDDMGMMNAMSNEESVTWELIDEETGKKNDQINWTFKQGEYIRVKIYNDPNSMHPMQHPIHLHGQRFLVVTKDGQMLNNLAWKDTYQVPTGSTVELLVEMSNPGDWMLHCHIAEHLSAGMHLTFSVE